MKDLLKGMDILLAKIENRFEEQPLFACFGFFGKRGIEDTLMEFNTQIKH